MITDLPVKTQLKMINSVKLTFLTCSTSEKMVISVVKSNALDHAQLLISYATNHYVEKFA